MNTIRKKSDSHIKAQKAWPSEERDTLITCPVCGGCGLKELSLPDGRYKVLQCRWCSGNGSVTKDVYIMFNRWLSILKHNRYLNPCNKHQ